MFSLPLRASVLVASLLALGACRSAAPSAAPKSPAAASATNAPESPSGQALVNVRRDRRADPGVRAAAKPLVLGKPGSVKCGTLAKAPADGDVLDLLGGRLRVRPPVQAKAPSVNDGLAAEEESRLVVDGGKLSLAIVAKETFQLDTDLFEPEAGASPKPDKLDLEASKFLKATFPTEEPLEIVPVEIGPAKLRAYAGRPREPNASPGKDTALVLALLVAREEGELESIGFYVRGETVRNATGDALVGCTRLAERIASTVTPGARALERAAGRRKLLDVASQGELAMTVPADYVAVTAGTSARIYKLRPLSLYAGSITVTLADAGEKKLPDGADTPTSGKLLGRSVEWRGKSTPRGGFAFVNEPLDQEGRAGVKNVEVLVKATRQAKALDELRSVAETIELVKKN